MKLCFFVQKPFFLLNKNKLYDIIHSNAYEENYNDICGRLEYNCITILVIKKKTK